MEPIAETEDINKLVLRHDSEEPDTIIYSENMENDDDIQM